MEREIIDKRRCMDELLARLEKSLWVLFKELFGIDPRIVFAGGGAVTVAALVQEARAKHGDNVANAIQDAAKSARLEGALGGSRAKAFLRAIGNTSSPRRAS